MLHRNALHAPLDLAPFGELRDDVPRLPLNPARIREDSITHLIRLQSCLGQADGSVRQIQVCVA
jgi:hypothetical protein